MIIAVQKGMSFIKEQLEMRGYKVVYRDEYNHPIDVFIHRGKSDESFTNSLPPSGFYGSVINGASYHGGVFEINANGKNMRDIEMMLQSSRHNNTRILYRG